MKIKFLRSFFFLTLCISKAGFSQSDLQKMLNSANNIKKNSPAQNSPSQPSLPAGYDNSWKVMITISRTVTSTTDLTRPDGTKCPETEVGSSNYKLHANFSSDQMVANYFEDDFEVSTHYGDDMKSFEHPFTGNYHASSSAHMVQAACGSKGSSEGEGEANIDVSQMNFYFTYNTKRKEGHFSISTPDEFPVQGSGKMTASGTGPSKTFDQSELAKSQMSALTKLYGNFSSSNFDLTNDAYAQQLIKSSPINGGKASIGKTRYGYEVSYSQSMTVDSVPWDMAGKNSFTYTTNVQILITNQDPPQYDAIIELVNAPNISNAATDYAKWIPQGPPPPSKNPAANSIDKGNSLVFDVYLVDKKKPDQKLTGKKYDVDFKLTDVSKEPGYCNNYPLDAPDDGKKDLIFDPSLRNASNATYDSGELKTSDYHGEDFIAVITSYDYGSFAKLTATVTLEEGNQISAHFKNDKKTIITLPKDDNNNQIADEWEIKNNIYNKNYLPTWDEEKSPNNDYNGDGLTLYEEYRGVISKGKFMSLDPNKKDLFVINLIGDAIKPGLTAMQKAAGINIVELLEKEANSDKMVNFNFSDFHGKLQSAIKCVKHDFQHPDKSDTLNGATQGNNVIGAAIAKNYAEDGSPLIKSPKDCIEYRLNGNRVGESDNVTKNVAHELGHACGLLHHGDDVPGLKFSKIMHQASSYDSVYIYYPDGNLVYKASATNLKPSTYLPTDADDMGVPNCTASGNVRCFMTYNEDYEYLYKELKQMNNTIYQFIMSPFGAKKKLGKPFDPSQYIYCTDPAGTEWNKDNKLFGKATRGDCIHQFRIKDW